MYILFLFISLIVCVVYRRNFDLGLDISSAPQIIMSLPNFKSASFNKISRIVYSLTPQSIQKAINSFETLPKLQSFDNTLKVVTNLSICIDLYLIFAIWARLLCYCIKYQFYCNFIVCKRLVWQFVD